MRKCANGRISYFNTKPHALLNIKHDYNRKNKKQQG